MEIPAAIAAEMAMARQNVALSVIKANADQQKALANIIEQSVRNVPAGSARGGNFNRFA